MLNEFILNSLDTFNIIYLWTSIIKKNNKYELFYSVLTISILITISDNLGLNFVVTYIMAIVAIKIIYKMAFKNIIYGFLLIVLIDILMQLMLSLIIGKVVSSFLVKGFIIEIIILICVTVFLKINLLYINISFRNIDSNVLIYLISLCSVYAIIIKIIWNYYNYIILDNLWLTSLLISVLLISQILVYRYIVNIIRDKENFKISNEYNSVIKEIVEEIKQRQHDFVNYKNTIRGIIEILDEKEIKKAISKYMKDEDIYDNEINNLIYIDNVIIKSIIYLNICRARKYDINLEYKVENDVLDNILSYQEISNIVNNLLNNAFDEVLRDKCINKNIKIKIFTENYISHLIIQNKIVNDNDINLNEMFTRGYSTKNKDISGYGLYNVQSIVNSHKGYIKIKLDCEEIIFDIYFNNNYLYNL
ncbi:sensor histidine kinase [Clostridium estertheticum]|uniref:GHKL domain-containing protein n=1 Tax=Clostridium estertheticum TaxID=238834 RepID=A0A7Y3T0E1_9CLOT|nr:GHKL domain-containing protein [Clostridium estertheticum]MBW9171758.1 GHKL domain-containing protein [Clostridium estertheticum]NNU77074.1 GHKL domain-containing protein [Clostridium estertheticum]WBL47838.1 GHKL domain-containing protein [Clostridium estertheticum]WLC75930.1 GHKL domain-containing protein [Clostridium estertheticum]